MKKIIAVIAFFAITLLSTDTAFAQENSSRNLSANAKTFTHKLTKQCNLDGTQQRAIYNAHMLRDRKINALSTAKNDHKAIAKGAKTSAEATVISNAFDRKIKGTLSKEQFAKYQKTKAKNKA
ncbi:MAG: hypothetical protein HRT69_03120 [Flavobacteriaceae bacterium]|nr:hypothetical protein [Flavobacteriaceae bacterium]